MFHSKKEAKRYGELKLLEQAGEITNLTREPKDCTFAFEINGVVVCKYICDARYDEAGVHVVEDTKSDITRKDAQYRIKKKLMKACFGIEIRET